MKKIFIHVAACTEQGEIKLYRFFNSTEARKFIADFKAAGGRVIVGWGEK